MVEDDRISGTNKSRSIDEMAPNASAALAFTLCHAFESHCIFRKKTITSVSLSVFFNVI